MLCTILKKIKKMNVIKTIEIKYFRSIYSLRLSNINDCLVFSGKNDCGKSNILKALNLFFNNKTDWETAFNFYSDFNFNRLSEVREESIKGKQFIQISITFIRGNAYQNTLPEFFTVKKQWDRYSSLPKISDDLEKQLENGKIKNSKINIIRRSLTGYLNRIKFEYVPAIKDKRLFEHVLGLLQKDIIEISLKRSQGVENDVKNVSDKFQSNVELLSKEFRNSTDIDTVVGLPIDLAELFKVLDVSTKYGSDEEYNVSLNSRGDGIRLRYLPSLYNFLAQNHNGLYILGFEEPENSMEYALSTKMARDFQISYSKNAQIFITSHSSAFLFDYSGKFSLYRVFKESNITKASKLFIKEDNLQLEDDTVPDYKLREEIGLTQLQKMFHKQYEEKLKDFDKKVSQVQLLEQQVAKANKPIVFTEGKTDVSILNTAWSKLYEIECPFELLPVETTDEDGGDGGYSALNRKLESVRSNEKLQIGIYDNDEAGNQKGFQKLNKNFSFLNGNKYVKIHKNKRAIAIVLPSNDSLADFERYKNLPIEFYFSQNDISKEINGKKLIIEPLQRQIIFNGEVIDTLTREDLYLSKINSDSKKFFAETIVQTFEKESFENFKTLFKLITECIDENNN
jgi:predicted ATP-dependent endonuclease of OLD family